MDEPPQCGNSFKSTRVDGSPTPQRVKVPKVHKSGRITQGR